MDKLKEIQLAVLGAFLALGVIVSALIASDTVMAVKTYSDGVISVTGAASKPIEADFASWEGQYGRRADTLHVAYGALKRDAASVRDYLLDQGIQADEMTFLPVTTTTLYARDKKGYSTNQIEGYKLTQKVKVSSARVDKVAFVSQGVTSLIEQGIAFTSYSPEYIYTQLDELKVPMLASATKNARERASSIAGSTGNKVGALRSASMGVFQITPQHSTDVSDYGINDTSARYKKITAVINATFEVK